MSSSSIKSFKGTPIYIQAGYGVPDHISLIGTEYTDLLTAIKYINKNNINLWVPFIDGSFSGVTGGTSGSVTFTGGTVTGATYFTNGVTANTISATTYYGLPIDIKVTGGTFSSDTAIFTNNTGGTFSVTGFSTQFTGGVVTGATNFTNGLTANTISATTYQNLPSHNNLTGLQGGLPNQYYHFPLSGYTYLTDVVQNDKIGLILSAITIAPTYTAGTSSITNVTNTFENGSTQSINITQTFVQNDSGSLISQVINKNGVSASTTSAFSESLVIVASTTYNGNVTYAQGPCKNNNIGLVDCTNRIQSGTTTAATRTVTGIYPVFYLKSSSPITDVIMQNAISAGTATKLVVASTGTITIPYNLSSQYMAFAYPATSPTKTTYFVTSLDTGPIGGVFPGLSTLSVNSSSSFWSNISYKIHTSNLLNNSAANIQFS